MTEVPAGLCDECRHQRVVRNTRGSRFSLCRRAADDSAYQRYPQLPVLACPGFEPVHSARGGQEAGAETGEG